MRLAGGSLPNEGRVEICFGNLWGAICDDDWGREEARVVCKQLGYVDTSDSIPYVEAFFGHGLTPIHLDDLACAGNESGLAECSHSRVGRHNCLNDEDAGVACIGKFCMPCLPGLSRNLLSLLWMQLTALCVVMVTCNL